MHIDSTSFLKAPIDNDRVLTSLYLPAAAEGLQIDVVTRGLSLEGDSQSTRNTWRLIGVGLAAATFLLFLLAGFLCHICQHGSCRRRRARDGRDDTESKEMDCKKGLDGANREASPILLEAGLGYTNLSAPDQCRPPPELCSMPDGVHIWTHGLGRQDIEGSSSLKDTNHIHLDDSATMKKIPCGERDHTTAESKGCNDDAMRAIRDRRIEEAFM
ncbi:hypothetical protein BJ165DRAFT_1437031 [Panaeolus papilionaceus]|nr:hypothetical protein BJ165DRAFT_1437031 [Panaeolus papilionaceus]